MEKARDMPGSTNLSGEELQKVLELFGTIDFAKGYNYKTQRKRQ